MLQENLFPTNILIVDDHPMTVDGYVALISSLPHSDQTKFHLAYNARQAFKLITDFKDHNPPHLAFLDINLPAYEEQEIFTGVDLAMRIRTLFPDCKIIIITMHSEPVYVNQILKSVNPEGFISKSEINYRTFPQAIHNVIQGEKHYSESIKKSHQLFLSKNITWDEYDSRILQLLSEGKKTVSLPEYLGLSLSTIEKRKARIKKQLVLDGKSDQEMLDVAKEFGLL
ncbi:MAG: response regulator transcription factor [Flavobacterium sp.]|nr:response regulator transcription factor [Flavobacterium sp.]